MGQYYKDTKIGTCESMYYLRLSQAQELAELGASDDDGVNFSEYITDNVTRFRFPFPDEDVMSDTNILINVKEHNRGFLIPAGEIIKDINHQEICLSNNYKSGGSNINIFIPCPHSQEFKNKEIKTSMGGAGEQELEIKMQAIRNGKEKTIFACPRCEQEFWISDNEILKLRRYLIDYYQSLDSTGKTPNRFGDDYDYKSDQDKYTNVMEIINRIK